MAPGSIVILKTSLEHYVFIMGTCLWILRVHTVDGDFVDKFYSCFMSSGFCFCVVLAVLELNIDQADPEPSFSPFQVLGLQEFATMLGFFFSF